MKNIVIAALLSLAACGVETSAVPEDIHEQSATEALGAGGASPAANRTCSPLSPAICAGIPSGTICHVGPTLWCLPSNDAPDGGFLCLCQAQTTI
jgi:hypothetical protein